MPRPYQGRTACDVTSDTPVHLPTWIVPIGRVTHVTDREQARRDAGI